MNDFVPFIVFALPILLGVIFAKRYNFIFGFFSIFVFAYLIVFAFDNFVEADFIGSVDGLLTGLNDLKARLVSPFYELLMLAFEKGDQLELFLRISENKYYYLGLMLGIYIILHIVSAYFRKRRINEIKKLKRESRRL